MSLGVDVPKYLETETRKKKLMLKAPNCELKIVFIRQHVLDKVSRDRLDIQNFQFSLEEYPIQCSHFNIFGHDSYVTIKQKMTNTNLVTTEPTARQKYHR